MVRVRVVGEGRLYCTNDFANFIITFVDGRRYGVNVWTYRYLETELKEGGSGDGNLIPPDLLVEELTRKCLQRAIEQLLEIDDLDKVLNPRVRGVDL